VLGPAMNPFVPLVVFCSVSSRSNAATRALGTQPGSNRASSDGASSLGLGLGALTWNPRPGSGRCCPPRHRPEFEPSFLEWHPMTWLAISARPCPRQSFFISPRVTPPEGMYPLPLQPPPRALVFVALGSPPPPPPLAPPSGSLRLKKACIDAVDGRKCAATRCDLRMPRTTLLTLDRGRDTAAHARAVGGMVGGSAAREHERVLKSARDGTPAPAVVFLLFSKVVVKCVKRTKEGCPSPCIPISFLSLPKLFSSSEQRARQRRTANDAQGIGVVWRLARRVPVPAPSRRSPRAASAR